MLGGEGMVGILFHAVFYTAHTTRRDLYTLLHCIGGKGGTGEEG